MKFEERKEKFQDELVELTKKYDVELYVANCVMPNGEVLPVLKMNDLAGSVTPIEDGNKA